MKKFLLIIVVSVICLSLSGCMMTLLAAKASTADIPVGANIDDSSLYFAIRSIIYQQLSSQEKAHVEVSVFNRVAILVGFVPTEQDKENLNHAVAQLPDLHRFYDFTFVNPRPPEVSYLNDSMITAKVKLGLLGDVNPMNFKVLTYNRDVFLLGRCKPARCKKALTIARHTRGVDEVINVLTVISAIQKDAPIKTIPLNISPQY